MLNSRKFYILILFVLLNFSLYFYWKEFTKSSEELKVYFFDVGQGDSIFIQTKKGKQILIDGGPDQKIIEKLSKVMPFWDRRIDLIILTHPEYDHLNGLLEVLKRYKINGIIDSEIECLKEICQIWQELKSKEKALIIHPKIGQEIVLDEETKILILHPFENLAGKSFSRSNNTSTIAKLILGSYSILLTGDIEKEVEEKLILADIAINSDYLKIPHHGSKTSSTDEFLDSVSPIYSFISLGAGNRYGHPHKEVIDRLEKRKIKYYRTDIERDILLSCKINQPCQVKKQN